MPAVTITIVDVVLMSGPSDVAMTYGCHNVEVHKSCDYVVDVVCIALFVPRNDELVTSLAGARHSAVGIATRYGLDGPGIESRWGRDFPRPYRPTLGPTQPSVQWVPGLPRG